MSTFTLLCFILLYFFTGITGHSYDPDGLKAAADYLLEAIDTNANPCKDFYQFACGNWKRKYTGQYRSERDKVTTTYAENLIKLIRNINKNASDTPQYQKRLKVFFDQCVQHTSTDPAEILKNIYLEILKHIGPMPLLDPDGVQYQDPYYLVGFLERQFGADVLLRVEVTLIKEECGSKPVIQLRPFWRYDQFDENFNQTFPDKLMKLALDIGANVTQENVTRRISQLVQFHQSPNYTWEYHGTLFRLSELSTKVNSKVNWEQLFRGLMPPNLIKKWKSKDPEVSFVMIKYFNDLHIWMNQLTYNDLLDLAYLRIFDHYLQNFNARYNKILENSTAPEAHCLDYVLESNTGAAAVRLYFDSTMMNHKHNPKLMSIWKNDVELLSEAMFAGFNYMIQTADWLDVESKTAFVELVKNVEFISGIPKWFLNDTYLLKHTPPFDASLTRFQNDLNMYRHKFECKLELMVEEPNEIQLHYLQDIDYAYHSGYFYFLSYGVRETIIVSLGTTLPPLHNISYPMPVKFGILGYVIARALMFDIFGTVVNQEVPLITEYERELFEQLVLCVAKQFSGYCFPEQNFCIQGGGMHTLYSSVAPMEGLKLAYMSYKFTSQMAGAQVPLPGLERFTQDQVFFLSTVRFWCETGEDAGIFRKDKDFVPPQASVELSMMNFPAFAQAFNCPTGEKFAPLHTCSLWGDFLEPNIEKVKLNESELRPHLER